MRRFRNPRYAPESLERRLHPSGLNIPVTAEFVAATPASTSATPHAGGLTNMAVDPPPTPPSNPNPDPDPDPYPCPTPGNGPGIPQEPDNPS